MSSSTASTFTFIHRWITRICALLVLAGGVVSALGWITGMPRLADWFNNGISIKFNPSLCLIIVGIGVLFGAYYPRYSRIVRVLGGLAAFIAAATLLQTALGVNFGVDTLFFNEAPGASATLAPGRMGVPASTAFILLGTALILGTLKSSRHVAAMLGVTTLCIALLSLVGYAFGADELYALPRLTGIALPTALMIALLAIGVAASIPDHGIAAVMLRKDGGGIMLRLSLPLILIGIFAFTWLLLNGIKLGFYDLSFAAAIRVLFEILMLTGVLWWTANHVAQTEKFLIDAVNAAAKIEIHQRIADTQEAERRRISRDLHDHIGQEVTGLRFALARLCEGKDVHPELVGEINTVCQKMEKLDAEVSNLAWQLRPPALETDGIVVSIRRLGTECTAIHELAFDFHASNSLPGLPAETLTHIYRIAQESMNNVVKHAKASRIGVTLDYVNGEVRLAVEDDGTGFRDFNDSLPGTRTGGFGLVGMRERAAIVGGTLEIETTPGKGTTILVSIPLATENQASPISRQQLASA